MIENPSEPVTIKTTDLLIATQDFINGKLKVQWHTIIFDQDSLTQLFNMTSGILDHLYANVLRFDQKKLYTILGKFYFYHRFFTERRDLFLTDKVFLEKVTSSFEELLKETVRIIDPQKAFREVNLTHLFQQQLRSKVTEEQWHTLLKENNVHVTLATKIMMLLKCLPVEKASDSSQNVQSHATNIQHP